MGFLFFIVKSIIVLVPCQLLNPSIDAYRPSYHNRHIVKGFDDFWTRSRTCLISTDCPLYSGKHSHRREEQTLKITLHVNLQLWQLLADSSYSYLTAKSGFVFLILNFLQFWLTCFLLNSSWYVLLVFALIQIYMIYYHCLEMWITNRSCHNVIVYSKECLLSFQNFRTLRPLPVSLNITSSAMSKKQVLLAYSYTPIQNFGVSRT